MDEWIGNNLFGQPELKTVRTAPHLTPVPLHRWHVTTLSPFLSKPLPSQFLHFCFFLMFGPFSFAITLSKWWVKTGQP